MDARRLFCMIAKRSLVITALVVLQLARGAQAQNQDVPGCGRLGDNYIGYARDYYTATPADLNLVERMHFRDEHAALMRGKTTINNGHYQGPVAGGFDYVLRVWPNHPGAMADLVTYGRRKKSEKPDNLPYPISCYFKRAMVFLPEDGVVRYFYAMHLLDFGREHDALEQLEKAEGLISNPTTNIMYNMGLLYVQLKRYEDARRLAREVYGRGYDLPGLRRQLERVGQWSGMSESR